MNKMTTVTLCIAALILLVCADCGKGTEAPTSPNVSIEPLQLRLFQPLPEVINSGANRLTEEKIALGRMLYYENRLSKGQDISCNSCHLLDSFGVDNQPTSDGHKGLKGDRNSPSVYNAAGHFMQFWDGRATDVEAQAIGPITNPVEMAMPSEEYVIAVLKSMPEYIEAFQKAFPEDAAPISYDNMAKAIGAFERKLLTPSRWDRFLRGDQNALTSDEKAGFNAYMEAGCQACHAGPYLGGEFYQKLGVVKDWPDSADLGREKVTKLEADRMMFKVPGLRNVEKTKPYYHNGSMESLEEAVSRMAEYQLGKSLSDEELKSIIAFLRSLTGDIPAEYIRPPVLPQSTDKTPKPDIS